MLNLNIHTLYFSHAVNYSHKYVTFWYVWNIRTTNFEILIGTSFSHQTVFDVLDKITRLWYLGHSDLYYYEVNCCLDTLKYSKYDGHSSNRLRNIGQFDLQCMRLITISHWIVILNRMFILHTITAQWHTGHSDQHSLRSQNPFLRLKHYPKYGIHQFTSHQSTNWASSQENLS